MKARRILHRTDSMGQLHLRYLTITRTWGSNVWPPGGTTVWLQIAGRKPLAHLSRWRRRLLHLPSVRVRLWPRPLRKRAYTEKRWAELQANRPEWMLSDEGYEMLVGALYREGI